MSGVTELVTRVHLLARSTPYANKSLHAFSFLFITSVITRNLHQFSSDSDCY